MTILTPEIKDFVKKAKLAFVATVCPDGTPNLSPKGTTTVWDDEHLVFADIHSPGTTENIQTNPSIEINIVDVFLRKGYRFKGRATILSNGPLFEQILSFYKNEGLKYPVQHMVLIKIERIQPVFSPAYDSGISEEEVVKRWTEYWNNIYPYQQYKNPDKS